MVDAQDSGLTSPVKLANRFFAISHYDNVVIAVSGGSDSMALLHLVRLWLLHSSKQAQPAVSVCTVDHGLRAGSEDEALFVENAARALGYQHHTLHWDGVKPTSGLQDLARNARYDLLTEYARKLSGRTAILTAHTQNDQAETVLMRLGRGSGPDGMAAIPELTLRHDIAIVRPLLDVTRSQLVAFLDQVGQTWREDPSNTLIDFERIRIRNAQDARNELALSDQALAQTAKRMQRARNSLRQVANDLLSSALDDQELLQYGVFEWSREALERYGHEVAIRCLRQIVKVVGGSHEQPNLSQTEALYDQLRCESFRGWTLHGARLVRERNGAQDKTLIFRETGRNGLATTDLAPGDFILWDGRFLVHTLVDLPENLRLGPLGPEDLEQLEMFRPRNISTALANQIALTLPAVWQGDQLIGLPHLRNCCPQISLDPTYIRRQLCP